MSKPKRIKDYDKKAIDSYKWRYTLLLARVRKLEKTVEALTISLEEREDSSCRILLPEESIQ